MDRSSWHFANRAVDMANTLASRAHRDLATADLEKHPKQPPSPSASTPLLFSAHHTHTYTRAHTPLQAPNNRRSGRWVPVFPRNSWDKTILLVFLCSLLIFGHALFGLGLADAGLAKVRGEFHELHWHPFAHVQPYRLSLEEDKSGGMGLKSASVPAHIQAPPLRPQAHEEPFPPQSHAHITARPIVGDDPEL